MRPNSFEYRQLCSSLLFQFQGLYIPLHYFPHPTHPHSPKPTHSQNKPHFPKPTHSPEYTCFLQTTPIPRKYRRPRKTNPTKQTYSRPRQRSRAALASQAYPIPKAYLLPKTTPPPSQIYLVSKKPYLPFGLIIIRSQRDPICPFGAPINTTSTEVQTVSSRPQNIPIKNLNG